MNEKIVSIVSKGRCEIDIVLCSGSIVSLLFTDNHGLLYPERHSPELPLFDERNSFVYLALDFYRST